MYMCDPPPNSEGGQNYQNVGGKILGCLKTGVVNYVLIMSQFLRDFKEI